MPHLSSTTFPLEGRALEIFEDETELLVCTERALFIEICLFIVPGGGGLTTTKESDLDGVESLE